MTIHHQAEQAFDIPIHELIVHVRAVLATNPSYQQTAEDATGLVFSTEVLSYWGYAPTPLTIVVMPRATQTVLLVRVTSQVFIWSEMFATESPAIQHLLNAVQQQVQRAQRAVVQPPTP